MRWGAIAIFVGVLCGSGAFGQQVEVPLKDTGNGLRIEGPAEIEPRFGEDYDVLGLATKDLPQAKIMVFPEEGVRVRTGRPWGDGAPYITVRVNLSPTETERLIRLWVVVDHLPKQEESTGIGPPKCVHVPDEWAHVDILVKRPGPPPPPPDPADLTIEGATVKETSASAKVQVILSKSTPADVLFAYATKNGTATEGHDFKMTSGQATIPKGASSFEIAVPILDDQEAEGTETFTVELSNVTNANALQTVATVTIEDDDKPTVTELSGVIIHDPQAEENQGGNLAILMYGPPINDLLGDEKWQPISTKIETQQKWLAELIDRVVDEDLPEPHIFLMDWETKEVVWNGQMTRDIEETIETVKRFMP